MTITFDTDVIANLVKDGDKIFLTPEGEQSLLEFAEIEKQVEQAKEDIKAALEASGLALSPDFKSIYGDRVKVGYQYFGSKYKIIEGTEDQVPENCKKTVVSIKPESKAIEEFLKENAALPYGIETGARKKTIVIKPVEDDGDVED